ncbi:MAG: RNA-binding protein [Candidatus Pacebacteria bacterium]|nr:RNA-binding protein [Candidatus Paceibacterota bacterium]
MGNKIFVGNLPFSTDDAKLKEMFSAYGEISEAVIIKNKFSGRSKGFGFVTFANEADAQKAIAAMNEKEVEGRKMTVKEATPFNPDAPRPRRSFGDRGSGGFGGRRGGFGGERRGGFGGGQGRFNKREESGSDNSQDGEDY